MDVLFVCRGNVARSQWAEALFNRYSQRQHRATSAGTQVSSDEEGRPLVWYPNVYGVMQFRKINIAYQQRKQLTPEMIERAGMVVSLAEKEFSPDYLLNCPKTIYWDVPDPRGTDFDRHFEIMESVEGLVKKLLSEMGE